MTTEECDIIRRRNWCNTHECVVKYVNVSSTKGQYNEKKMKYKKTAVASSDILILAISSQIFIVLKAKLAYSIYTI